MLNKTEIIKLVKELKLPCDGYWISAGAGLVLHDVKDFAGDIDIGCTEKVFEVMLERGNTPSYSSDGTRRTKLGDKFEFFENWNVDDIICIDSINVASLPSIKKQKIKLGRPKDFEDIALIDSFINNKL